MSLGVSSLFSWFVAEIVGLGLIGSVSRSGVYWIVRVKGDPPTGFDSGS